MIEICRYKRITPCLLFLVTVASHVFTFLDISFVALLLSIFIKPAGKLLLILEARTTYNLALDLRDPSIYILRIITTCFRCNEMSSACLGTRQPV